MSFMKNIFIIGSVSHMTQGITGNGAEISIRYEVQQVPPKK